MLRKHLLDGRGRCLGLAVVLAVGAMARGASAQNILIYDDNTFNQRGQAAVASLGYTWTVGTSSTFNTLLGSATWDLVLVDCPSSVPQTAGNTDWLPLMSYVTGGGKAILSFWDLDNSSGYGNAALPGVFGVSVAASFQYPETVYVWDPLHPVYTTPNAVGDLTSFSNPWYDDGEELSLLAGSTALGGFTSAPAAGKAAVVLANGDRTIVNGFLFDEANDPDGTKLIANEAKFLLDGSGRVPEPGACAFLAAGALGGALAVRRRRR